MIDHDYQELKGKPYLHSVLRRDFVCGICFSKLITVPEMNEQERRCDWKTVCANDRDHDPDQFIHTYAAARRQSEALVESLVAREVFSHLPPALQEQILANQ